MDKNKLVSIIVPAYNVEQYLSRCIESLLSQTYTNIEIILVDDGSKDSTPTLCDEFAESDSRVVVIHQENKGQCVARNAALDMAQGDYLMFVDSDDYIRRDMVQRMMGVLENEEFDLIRSAYTKVKEQEYSEVKVVEDTGEIVSFNQKGVVENFLTAPYSPRKCFTAIVWAALYRSELFDNVRFPEGLIYEEGFVLPSVYLKIQKAGYIDESFYYYRSNAKGTMAQNSVSDKTLKSIDDWKGIHYSFKEQYPEFNSITCNKWIEKYLNILYELIKLDSVDKTGFYKKKIVDTLVQEREYFVQMNVKKEFIKEIDLLKISLECWNQHRQKTTKRTKPRFLKLKQN